MNIRISLPRLLLMFVWLTSLPAMAAGTRVDVWVAITNNPTQSNLFNLNGESKQWRTNVLVPSTQIQITNTIGFNRTNFLQALVNYQFTNNVTAQYGTNTNDVVIYGPKNYAMAASSVGTWCTITFRTNAVYDGEAVRAGTNLVSRESMTNQGSAAVEYVNVATNRLKTGITALANYLDLTTSQTASNKTLVAPLTQGETATNLVIQRAFVAGTNFIGFSNAVGIAQQNAGGGLRFFGLNTTNYSALTCSVEDPWICYVVFTNNGAISSGFADVSVFAQFESPLVLNIGSALKLFPILDATIFPAATQVTNTWLSSNIFGGGFSATNVDMVNVGMTNARGAFVGLTATNFQALAGYLSALFLNGVTISNSPVIVVTNLQALSGYFSNVFANNVIISNSPSINGTAGKMLGGLYTQSTISDTKGTNACFFGTNDMRGDLSFPWYSLTSIGAGNNIAVPLGTNVFVALSGNSGAAALCGFTGGRNGLFYKLLNRSSYAMTLAQNTIDPVPANRLVGNVSGDWTFNPGEWIDIVWDDAAARYRFVVPTTAATNLANLSLTNSSIYASSGTNQNLRIFAWLNGTTNVIEVLTNSGANIIFGVNSNGQLYCQGLTNNGVLQNGGPIVGAAGSKITGSQTNSLSASRLIANDANSVLSTVLQSSGQLPIGNASGNYTMATLTAGSGMVIANGSGSITVSMGSSGFTTNLTVAAVSASAIPLTIQNYFGTPPTTDLLRMITNSVTAGGFLSNALAYARINASNAIAHYTLSSDVADVTVTNTTSETSLLPASSGQLGTYSLDPSFWYAGRKIEIDMRGVHWTPAAAPGACTVKVKLGSTVLFSQSFTPGTSIAGEMWRLNVKLNCRTIGASGTIGGQGWMDRINAAGGTTWTTHALTNNPVTIDTTASALLDVTMTPGATTDSFTTRIEDSQIK
jgi:hypothetical protein